MNKGTQSNKKYIFTLARVIFLIFVALVLPRFFLVEQNATIAPLNHEIFKLGIESLTDEFLSSLSPQSSADYTVGLVTNHTALDQKGNRTAEILLSKGLRVQKIFIPEDDFFAYKKNFNADLTDDKTEIPLAMLAHIDSLKKSREYNFNDVDVLFFDMQDSGINPSVAMTTLLKTLQSAAKQNKTMVVLDRPNLLGCSMEGIINDGANDRDEQIPVPMRHGMTCGELARYFNTTLLASPARLFVVPMQNYTRDLFSHASTAAHASLLTNIDAYYGASFLPVLGAVKPFDIGLGTDLAFSCLFLPESEGVSKQKWFELRALLKEQGIETSWHRYYNPKKRCYYSGLRFLVRNVDQFSPFNTVVTVVHFFKDAGVPLSFLPEFDHIFGGKKMRSFLEGKCARHDLEYAVNKGLKTFFNKAHSSLIYKPAPKVVLL